MKGLLQSLSMYMQQVSFMNIGHLVLSEAHTLDIYLVIPTDTLRYKI